MLELCRCPNIYGPDCMYVVTSLVSSVKDDNDVIT